MINVISPKNNHVVPYDIKDILQRILFPLKEARIVRNADITIKKMAIAIIKKKFFKNSGCWLAKLTAILSEVRIKPNKVAAGVRISLGNKEGILLLLSSVSFVI